MATKKRKLSPRQVARKFPDDEAAEQWFISQRWANGVYCPYCGRSEVSEGKNSRGKRRFRCRPCRRDFSTKTGSLMESSNLGYREWAIAIHQITMSLEGIDSTKLADDLDVTRKTARSLAMRIRRAYHNENQEAPERAA